MLMHEAMIAQSLLEAITREAEKHNAKPLSAIVSCSVFDAVNDEALGFAFDVIARKSVCESMELKIEHKPLRGQCKKCNKISEFEHSNPGCSNCGSLSLDLLPQPPLTLEQIEFEPE
ncbi:MAG: hydrogenase maturation nickel metallochaperone HypA/HybF [Planctomycetota bacterium]|jgi:hydrogenase nickel incorporation protein HypA/HybF